MTETTIDPIEEAIQSGAYRQGDTTRTETTRTLTYPDDPEMIGMKVDLVVERTGERDEIQTREILQFANLYDYSPVTFPAYKQTTVNARGKELAIRNRPEPEASGEDGAAAQEVRREAKANLQAIRESIQAEVNQ